MKKLLTILLLCVLALALTTGEAYAYRKVTVRQGMDLVKVFAGEDTKFVIKEDIDLGGKTVKMGEGCMLVFKGGSLANGKVVGNRTKVVNDVQLNNCIFRNIEQKYVIVNARKLDINNNVFE